MVRTKAGSVSTKAVGGKAPQKVAARAVAAGNAPKTKQTAGNPYHPRDTPEWQKPITFFMKQSGEDVDDETDETDLPGIPGVETNSPQRSGGGKKAKVRREEGSNGREEKAASEKIDGKNGAKSDAKERAESGRYKSHEDFDEEVEKNEEGKDREDEMYEATKEIVENEERTNGDASLDDAKKDRGIAAGSAVEEKHEEAPSNEANVQSEKTDEDKGLKKIGDED